MKINLLLVLLIFCNCITYKNETNDFGIVTISYNKEGIEDGRFIYHSDTGILIRDKKKVIILLDDAQKKDINNYFIELKFRNNCSFTKFEDGTSSKIILKFRNDNIEKKNCNTNLEENKKYILLYFKLRRALSSKNEYKEAFPTEFEIY